MSGEELKELEKIIANMFEQNASMLELMLKQQEHIDRLDIDMSKLTDMSKMPVRSAKPAQHISAAESAIVCGTNY